MRSIYGDSQCEMGVSERGVSCALRSPSAFVERMLAIGSGHSHLNTKWLHLHPHEEIDEGSP